jgi:hypothetical protein
VRGCKTVRACTATEAFSARFSRGFAQFLLAGVAPSLLYSRDGRVDPKEDHVMIRGMFGALAAMAVGTLLVSSAAQAASPITLKCVRTESAKMRTEIAAARAKFKAARAACYGPGQACAQICTAANDECLATNVTGPFETCNGNCTTAQRDQVDICRSQFQNGLITEAQLEQCANAARLVNLECRLACTDQYDEPRLNCNTAQAACLGACASCGTPQQCPAN